jgi:hypothetical protein
VDGNPNSQSEFTGSVTALLNALPRFCQITYYNVLGSLEQFRASPGTPVYHSNENMIQSLFRSAVEKMEGLSKLGTEVPIVFS